MSDNKSRTSVSRTKSYKDIGEFWDTHDVTQYMDQTHPVDFDVDIQTEVTYYPLDMLLSDKVRSTAKRRGVSPETLLNLWVQERLQQEPA
jgi:hypothetical protein